MAITFTLDGTPFTPQQGWNIADVSLGRSRFVCVVRSDDGSFSASAGEELEVDDGATSLFGGFVTTVTVTARPNDLGSDATDTRIEAEDYNGLPARRIVTEDIVAGNLKAAATVLVNDYLDDLGVSLHPSQVNGPTLPAISWLAVSGFDALNQLSEMSGGYVWTIDASKRLRFQVPGTDAAPFDVTDNTYLDDGDVEVSRSRQVFANTIVAVVGTSSVIDKTDTFDGDGVTDEFTLTYPVTGPMIGVVTVTEPGPIYRYETIDEIGVGAYWEIDRVNNSIQVGNHVNSQIPASGEDISFRYLAQFPITVTATDAPSVAADGIYEQRIDLPDVFDAAQAQAIVDGLLARGIVEKTTITYVTAESGLSVNQLQHITLPNRGIDADCIITGLVTLNVGGSRVLRTVTAVIGDQVLGSWRDVYVDWLGGGDGSGSSAIGASADGWVPVAVVPGGSDTHVQFNDGGAFGGDAQFTFEKTAGVVTISPTLTATGNPRGGLIISGSYSPSGAATGIHAAINSYLEVPTTAANNIGGTLVGIYSSLFAQNRTGSTLANVAGAQVYATTDAQTTMSGSMQGLYLNVAHSGTGNISQAMLGLDLDVDWSSTGTLSTMIGARLEVTNRSTNVTAVSSLEGIEVTADGRTGVSSATGANNVYGGLITTLGAKVSNYGWYVGATQAVSATGSVYGSYLSATATGAAAITGTIVGVQVDASNQSSQNNTVIGVSVSATDTGSGTAPNVYGLKVANVTGGTANYAIYTGTGVVRFGDYVEMTEITAPGAAPANGVRIYAVDNGGKTELLAIFPSGAAQSLAIEP